MLPIKIIMFLFILETPSPLSPSLEANEENGVQRGRSANKSQLGTFFPMSMLALTGREL